MIDLSYPYVSQTAIYLPAITLAVLLGAAMVFDIKAHRIPNKLVLAGIAVGVALHVLLPAGGGLLDASNAGAPGLYTAMLGLASGFAVFLPFYLLRAMGAGDVKLMAMVGLYLGPASVLDAALLTLVCGGVMAVIVALWNGVFRHAMTNVRFMLMHTAVRVMTSGAPRVEASASSAGNLPYAVAIAGGVLLQVLLARAGHTVFA